MRKFFIALMSAMNSEVIYTSQSRLNFSIEQLVRMGVKRAYVSPFVTNNELLKAPEFILNSLEQLKLKAEKAQKKGLEVYPFFITINHPEGNFKVPARYRLQQNIDGSPRPEFICFKDEVRQKEIIGFATEAAKLGFGRIMFDDDLRDAFCYCDEHIYNFEGFKNKSRDEIERILNGILSNPEQEQLRIDWYKYKYSVMVDYALRLEKAVHKVNPHCRIGICTSAKRCQDFSGRNLSEWIKCFSTAQAPSFVRLCGECYDDSMWHICQSTGWSQYTDSCYPENIDRMLEVTSVPTITYRSPGAVLFETGLLIAATANSAIHWAWPEEFERTGLCDLVSDTKNYVANVSKVIKNKPKSPLCIYTAPNLGPYTPINISIPYGATHDPINAYNIISLLGLPVIMRPVISKKHPAVICSSYISREMIRNIDEHVSAGGVAILDAKAAQCYRTYGGKVLFDIRGPVNLNRYEVLPDGSRCEIIAHCPPDSIYYVNVDNSAYNCKAFDIDEKAASYTTVVLKSGKGTLVVLGYDLSRTKQVLLCSQWRDRLLALFDFVGIKMSAYWQGPIGVQCFYYGDKVTLANYNANGVAGELVKERKVIKVKLQSLSLKII